MRWLKWTVVGVAGLALLVVGIGLLLPSRFTVTRSVAVAAPAEKIFPLVADPRRWQAWSVWTLRDPEMAVSYSGSASGAGAAWEWKSKSEGDGKMTFTAAESPRRIAYALFFPDFGTTSKGDFSFVPEGAGTRVTWTMNGDMGNNPLMSWFALFADGMVGKDFQASLDQLKQLAEMR